MKFKKLLPSLLLNGAILGLFTTPALSQEKLTIAVDKSTASTKTGANSTQQARVVSNSPSVKPIREIRSLSEIERPITSARMLVQSPTPQATPTSGVVEVTGVKANPSAKGVEIILQTTKGQALQLVNRSAGKNFIVDIPNAQLRLPSGDGFTFDSTKPVAGITQITVTNFDAKTIRVTVTGEANAPIVELFDSPKEGLIFSVASTAQSPQQGQPQTQQPPASQPENQTQPSQPSASGDEPIELVVTGEQDGYRVPRAFVTKTPDTSILNIPASIQVIPRQVLEDQKITRVRDAIQNVSGVLPGSNGSQSFIGERLIFRGFEESNAGSTFVNGFRRYNTLGYGRERDVANIEQLEILKGPASVLYGQGEPGGILNITTKQPLSTPYYAFEGTIGSFDFYRPSLDLSGPLNASKTIGYRLNGAYQNSGSYVDFVESEQVFVTPVISFDLGKNTNLTVEGEYFNIDKVSYLGIPASGTVIFNPLGKIPRSRFLDDPSVKLEREFYGFGYRFQHKFSDTWSIRNGFSAQLDNVDESYTYALGLRPDNRTLNRGGSFLELDAEAYFLQTDVIGSLQTGSIKQDLLFGLELGWIDEGLKSFRTTSPVAAIDIFNPNYNTPPLQFTFNYKDKRSQDSVGIYAQDLISIGDQFKVLLGGRFDFVTTAYERQDRGIDTEREDNAFSPRVGIVYQPIKPVSVYASWSRSFIPSAASARNVDGTTFKPTEGEQFEVGVKTEWLDGKLGATLAAYQITKQNIITSDPNNPTFSIQVGEQQSQGIELDVVGRILPGLNLIASYTYTDAEITKDNRGNQGNQPANVPEHSASLWATYEIQDGGLKGLGFGGGLAFVGDRKGNLANTYSLPSYVRTDATIFYRRDNWRAALNFKNLFDVYYFESADFGPSVFPGTPFAVQGTVSVQF